MDKSMLPSLTDFDIYKPGYIRKVDKRGHWKPEDCHDLETRAKAASERVFKANSENLHSLWYIETAEQFYGMIADLSAERPHKNQDIDFVWIDAEELTLASIELIPSPGKHCVFVSNLHVNARIDPVIAEKLCLIMMQADREAQRCKKKQHTTPMLEYQTGKGCKATETSREHCDCEVVNP
ncbi:MAG: hypothetical protein NW220_15820 [Leptolyngbyaceae cyanobacterium bins.349]|nr:hypothetical protein [Leptolyngbyaceae cyanobacterium bins.349]